MQVRFLTLEDPFYTRSFQCATIVTNTIHHCGPKEIVTARNAYHVKNLYMNRLIRVSINSI